MNDDGQAQDMDMDNQAEGEQDKGDVMTPADILYGKDEDIVESVTDQLADGDGRQVRSASSSGREIMKRNIKSCMLQKFRKRNTR